MIVANQRRRVDGFCDARPVHLLDGEDQRILERVIERLSDAFHPDARDFLTWARGTGVLRLLRFRGIGRGAFGV